MSSRRPSAAPSALLAACLCLSAAVAGCTATETMIETWSPFAESPRPAYAPELRPVIGAGVVVPPVQGAPAAVAVALAGAVAEGFRAAEIPARVADGGPSDHRVIGSVLDLRPLPDADALAVTLALELRDDSGRPVTIQTVRGTVPGALWRGESPPVEQPPETPADAPPQDADEPGADGAPPPDAESPAPADATAPAAPPPDPLADAARALVAPALPALAAAEQALVPVPEAEPLGLAALDRPAQIQDLAALPRVEILPITGAPGPAGNNDLMAHALRAVLREAGVPLTVEAATAGAAVTATIIVSPVVEDRERIAITWSVLTPEGSEIGVVTQENMLPAGYLEQQWADLAYIIAAAAVDGIVPLLERAQATPRAPAGGS